MPSKPPAAAATRTEVAAATVAGGVYSVSGPVDGLMLPKPSTAHEMVLDSPESVAVKVTPASPAVTAAVAGLTVTPGLAPPPPQPANAPRNVSDSFTNAV